MDDGDDDYNYDVSEAIPVGRVADRAKSEASGTRVLPSTQASTEIAGSTLLPALDLNLDVGRLRQRRQELTSDVKIGESKVVLDKYENVRPNFAQRTEFALEVSETFVVDHQALEIASVPVAVRRYPDNPRGPAAARGSFIIAEFEWSLCRINS